MRYILSFALFLSLIGISVCLIGVALDLMPLTSGVLALVTFFLTGYVAANGLGDK